MAIAARDSPTVKVGSPIDSTSAMCSEASRDASRTRPCIMCSSSQPAHADGQRRLVPGGRAQLPQLLEEAAGDVRMDPEGVAAQPGARGDAHRGAVRVVGGQRVGDLARPLPTEPRRRDIAVGRPRPGAHVPAVRGVQITGGLQMLGDQGGILVGRCRRHVLRSRRPRAGAARRDPI